MSKLTPAIALKAWSLFHRRVELEGLVMQLECELFPQQVGAVAMVAARAGLTDTESLQLATEFAGYAEQDQYPLLVRELLLFGREKPWPSLAVEAHTALHAQLMSVVSSPNS